MTMFIELTDTSAGKILINIAVIESITQDRETDNANIYTIDSTYPFKVKESYDFVKSKLEILCEK